MSSGSKSLEQPLTAEQIDEFSRLGFLVIAKPQIPEAELEWCRDILMRMILGGERRSEGRNFDLTATDGAGDMTSPSVLQPSMYARELRKLIVSKNRASDGQPIVRSGLPNLPAIMQYSSRAIEVIRRHGIRTKHSANLASTTTN